jgi:hypothetical protein
MVVGPSGLPWSPSVIRSAEWTRCRARRKPSIIFRAPVARSGAHLVASPPTQPATALGRRRYADSAVYSAGVVITAVYTHASSPRLNLISNFRLPRRRCQIPRTSFENLLSCQRQQQLQQRRRRPPHQFPVRLRPGIVQCRQTTAAVGGQARSPVDGQLVRSR